MSSQDVEYAVREHTAWLTMNRPEVLNALSKGMFQGLAKQVVIAEEIARYAVRLVDASRPGRPAAPADWRPARSGV